MKKRILIIHSNMEIGGAEISLLSLLFAFDYSKVAVDLFLYKQSGELLELIPEEVNLLDEIPQYEALMLPIKKVIANGNMLVGFSRLCAKFVCCLKNKLYHYTDYGYIVKQHSHYYALPFLPKLPYEYECAISFIDPHFIVNHKVFAKKKIGWFHTDFQRILPDKILEDKMWNGCDYIVNVSEACKQNFDCGNPCLKEKSIVIENMLSKEFIYYQATKQNVLDEMGGTEIKLLSIGRFCHQKNFDNIPQICKTILDNGVNVKWYLIGFGGDEALIRNKIAEYSVQNNVIILGKKENPYPYIKACDIYVQPSRYEGKSVAVREAQILNKPVIITNFSTSKSQLADGFDGIIIPMENTACAMSICNIIKDTVLQQKLIANTKISDYTNSQEIEKLYELVD